MFRNRLSVSENYANLDFKRSYNVITSALNLSSLKDTNWGISIDQGISCGYMIAKYECERAIFQNQKTYFIILSHQFSRKNIQCHVVDYLESHLGTLIPRFNLIGPGIIG